MMAARPFQSRDALLATARHVWFALEERDWREAFSHHPMIGDRDALRQRFPTTHQLSEREQAGVSDASDAVLDAVRGSATFSSSARPESPRATCSNTFARDWTTMLLGKSGSPRKNKPRLQSYGCGPYCSVSGIRGGQVGSCPPLRVAEMSEARVPGER
jgi:hypothetical protein